MYVLGVDLGTTYTAAAVWRDGHAETVPLGERAAAVPTVVHVGPDGVVRVGEAAVRHQVTDPVRVAREFKRGFGDPMPVLLGGAAITRQELTAHVLRWVVARATTLEGGPPHQVVITVPATWAGYRQDLLLDVASGVDLAPGRVTLLPEPAAAGVFYASRRRVPTGAVVGVYDLGGGTFDATVLRKTSGGFEICGAPQGHDELGGVDVDHLLQSQVEAQLEDLLGGVDRTDVGVRRTLVQLHRSVVEAKEALSSEPTAVVPVVLTTGSAEVQLSREQLADVCAPLLRTTADVFARALLEAAVDPADLHAVLLVGGSSRLPGVETLLRERFGRPVAVDAHPKYAVSLGAAVAGASTLEPVADGSTVQEAGSASHRGPLRPSPSRPVEPPPPLPRPGDGQVEVDPLPAPTEAPVTLRVDLEDMGLSDASVVPLAPAVARQPRVGPVVDQPVVIEAGSDPGYGASGRRAALLMLVVLLAVVAAVVLVPLLR